ncbi:hypothetical protein C2S53_004472 [Perilla frutescens var. hirtella]|uniref:Uncharacterized protein n=1 Tax=Perilla frutescens var. hirtella TaxID=608512 RepID=A0AAD4P2H6_PERFH|nr:hypothetical protein C2S53_004472 [Perilla frutescens var. hirtella]
MLKKVMAMIKVRMRAIETYLMIQSLLLRDKKMVRHLFQRRKCFKLEDEDHLQPDHSEAVISNSISTTPASMVQVAEEIEDTMEIEDEDDVHPVSVIDMVKNAQEGQGKEFVLEDDIDKVADLFIKRFHHQIWLQKQH